MPSRFSVAKARRDIESEMQLKYLPLTTYYDDDIKGEVASFLTEQVLERLLKIHELLGVVEGGGEKGFY